MHKLHRTPSQRRLGVAFKACLRYIHMRRRLDHVSHLESTVTINFVLNRHVYFSEHTPECDFNTHECDFSTQSVIFTRWSVISTRIGVVLTNWSMISTRRVQFSHAKCDFNTYECNFKNPYPKNPIKFFFFVHLSNNLFFLVFFQVCMVQLQV
jgi:hypothetical protein